MKYLGYLAHHALKKVREVQKLEEFERRSVN